MKKINFVKANLEHKETIFSWLAEPHVQEFWDNTQNHKDDIINFIQGRKTPYPSYCEGRYVYWIASIDNEPFAMLMTIEETRQNPIEPVKCKRFTNYILPRPVVI